MLAPIPQLSSRPRASFIACDKRAAERRNRCSLGVEFAEPRIKLGQREALQRQQRLSRIVCSLHALILMLRAVLTRDMQVTCKATKGESCIPGHVCTR